MTQDKNKGIANEPGESNHTPNARKPATERSQVEMLSRRLGRCSTELRNLVDGNTEIAPGDELWLNVIRHMAPGFLDLFHRLGVNIAEICNSMTEGEE